MCSWRPPVRSLTKPWESTETAGSQWDWTWLLGVAAVVLTAALQRSPVAGLGMLLPELQLGPVLAGALTAAPAVCIACAALVVPALHARHTTVALLFCATGLQAVGLAVRAAGSVPALVVGSVLAYSGIAVAGITLPAHLYQRFGRHAPRLTALVAATISGGVAATTATGHWANPLLVPIPVALLAWVLWLTTTREHHPAAAEGPPVGDAVPGRARLLAMARAPRARALTVFFGLQSALPVAMLSWEPVVFRRAGLSVDQAGMLVAITMTVSIVTALTLGAETNRARSQAGGIAVMTCAGIVGLAGLLLAPAVVPWLWAGLIGVGVSVLSVALHLPNLRTNTPVDGIALGSLVQGGGYLIAAAGPLAFAVAGPTAGIVMLLGAGFIQLALAGTVGRPHLIEPRTTEHAEAS